MIAVSIVSHSHGQMVSELVKSLIDMPEVKQIVVTLNVPERIDLPSDPRVVVVENDHPQGFGANHNAAFRLCNQAYFCPLNPDISLIGNPFPALLDAMAHYQTSLIAPLIISPAGNVEDSARRFPSLRELVLRPFGGKQHRYSLQTGEGSIYPDWIAGMFMLFNASDYARLSGFDENYYLYYEDVDICTRVWRAGLKVALCTDAQALHDARRASRSNLRHLRWHLCSMGKYYLRYWGRLPITASEPRKLTNH